MFWFKKNDVRKLSPRDPRFASVAEIRETFESLNAELFWLAEVITGDAGVAADCVVNATRLSESRSAIFRDWLAQWARNATVRSSLDHVRAEIWLTAEEEYQHVRCSHREHKVLSSDEISALQCWPAMTLSSHLDPLSRAVLILRGIEHAAVQDCALNLGVPRSAVLASYCGAIGWITCGTVSQFQERESMFADGLTPSLQKL
jgi:DNA-directed RNA polymerase specialized sigma24 family protein